VRAGPYDVVRVGQPPRTELAGWRYGERLKARERERLKVVVPVTIAIIGVTAATSFATGGSMGFMIWQYPRLGDAIYRGMVGRRKVNVEPPICERCGSILVLRARDLRGARVTRTAHQDLALLLRCPRCDAPGAMLEGLDAERALRSGLTFLNLRQRRRVARQAEVAAGAVERAGGPGGLIERTARQEPLLAQVSPDLRLALEMAVDEQAEVRDLEREWRRAEELADIADNLFVPRSVEEELKRLKGGGQPDG
jgi:hypothetical protein